MSKIEAEFRKWKNGGVIDNIRPFNSGGNGGQHGNRSMNAIEITASVRLLDRDGLYLTTIRATGTGTDKEQKRSKINAFRICKSRLIRGIEEFKKGEEIRKLTASFGDKRRRNYHQPDNRVTNAEGSHKELFSETVKGGAAFDRLVKENRRAEALK